MSLVVLSVATLRAATAIYVVMRMMGVMVVVLMTVLVPVRTQLVQVAARSAVAQGRVGPGRGGRRRGGQGH